MIRRPRLFILPTVCAAGLAMATFSCGGDDDDDNSGKTPTPTSTDTGVDTGTGTDTGTTTSTTETYNPGEVDIAVDANRDGVVDPTDEEDQEHENEWDTQYGASFLANVDDDNGDGVQDGSDADVNITVDNTHDQNDLARIKVTAWPDVPAGSVGTFSVDAAATGHVRIHKLNAADGTWSSVAGSVGPCGAGGDTNCNLVESFQLTAEEIARAMTTRAAIYARAQTFFQNYDLLISPATIVPPYPVEQRFVEHLGEHEFSNYIEWCSIAYAITIIGAPAVSVPCGFTSTGLPVGLQIAAAPLNEGPLLSAALLFEESADLTSGVPIDPVVTHQT